MAEANVLDGQCWACLGIIRRASSRSWKEYCGQEERSMPMAENRGHHRTLPAFLCASWCSGTRDYIGGLFIFQNHSHSSSHASHDIFCYHLSSLLCPYANRSNNDVFLSRFTVPSLAGAKDVVDDVHIIVIVMTKDPQQNMFFILRKRSTDPEWGLLWEISNTRRE